MLLLSPPASRPAAADDGDHHHVYYYYYYGSDGGGHLDDHYHAHAKLSGERRRDSELSERPASQQRSVMHCVGCGRVKIT